MNDHSHGLTHEQRQRETALRMSAQIAKAFAHLPDAAAAAQVATHINQFWSRSMRRDLALFFAPDAPELHGVVRQAWRAIRFPAAG
jgi:hypothetical protein